jgi:large subunit ribosomal protein L3
MVEQDRQGYRAVQVTWGSKKPTHLNRAEAGIFAKTSVDAGAGLTEFRLQDDEGKELAPGGEIKVDIFSAGQMVDVTGTTIGKGFAGAIKRHHFRMNNTSHGCSVSHRSAGSIGQRQTPGKVYKGKKMAGHLGNVQQTAINLEVVRVDSERNLLLIKGAVPGGNGSDVLVKPAVKHS